MKRLAIFLFVLFLMIPGLSFAEKELPNLPYEGYIYDGVGVIDSPTKDRIIGLGSALEQKTGAQVMVAIVPTTGEEPITDYAVRLFEKWQLGEKGKDNGLLLVIATEDHKFWLEVGYGLEGALTDSYAGQIVNQLIEPFRRGEYSRGVEKVYQDLVGVVAQEYQADLGVDAPPAQEEGEDVGFGFLVFIIFVFFFLTFFTMSMSRRRSRRMMRRGRRMWMDDDDDDDFFPPFTGGFGGGFGGFGGGGFSGGGFRGGGGSSGGGGAGGSW